MWEYTDSVIMLEQISPEYNELLECTQTSDKHHESEPWRQLFGGLGESLLSALLLLGEVLEISKASLTQN